MSPIPGNHPLSEKYTLNISLEGVVPCVVKDEFMVFADLKVQLQRPILEFVPTDKAQPQERDSRIAEIKEFLAGMEVRASEPVWTERETIEATIE